jgi:hypothetical protein
MRTTLVLLCVAFLFGLYRTRFSGQWIVLCGAL